MLLIYIITKLAKLNKRDNTEAVVSGCSQE